MTAVESSSFSQPARAPAPGWEKPKFDRDHRFHAALKLRVADYFRRTGLSPRDDKRMYVKTATILAWLVASYVSLVFLASTWWQGALGSASLAAAIAGVGFAVQHDANHGAYSDRRIVNRLLGMTLDLMGASSYLWHWQHNIFHHTYPNLSGADGDIDFLPFARLSPSQPYYRMHRFQRFYLWGLYAFLYPKWNFIDDFKNLARGRLGLKDFPRARGWQLVGTLAGKLVFVGWAFVLPMLFHRWWVVVMFYAFTAFAIGVVLAVVFQLAHCVEEAAFPEPSTTNQVNDAWAVHQVHSSVDFAQKNKLLTWYLGGLNFQIEHHLFPKICHVHYPELSTIVRSVCAEHGVHYAANDGFFGALATHWRWLRRMGALSPQA